MAALGQMTVLAESEPDNSALLLRKAEVAYLADAYDVVADTCMTMAHTEGLAAHEMSVKIRLQ